MRTLIRNGRAWLPDGPRNCSILIDAGRIVDCVEPGKVVTADNTIDAGGCDILPGLVDLHVHLDDRIGDFEIADTYASGTEAAVCNGITTVCTFVTQPPGQTMSQAVAEALGKAGSNSHCDYSLHLTPTRFGRKDWQDIEHVLQDGYRTFKFYTTYRQAGLYLEYRELGLILERVKAMGLGALVHCEDDDMLERAGSEVADPSDAYSHALSRPPDAEVEAIGRVLDIVNKTKCRTHFVHVSTAEGAKVIGRHRQDLAVSCETGPQYLMFDDGLLKQIDGHRYLCSPPLRDTATRQAMEDLAAQGQFDIYATDHCPFTKADKDARREDFTKVPKGLPGVGALVHVVHSINGKHGHDLDKLVEHLALRPAQIAGVYPRKGALQKGADADIVIINANGEQRPVQASYSDVYDPYHGYTTHIDIKHVLLRGKAVVMDNALTDPNQKQGRRV